jgi:hypothetical protein
MIINYLRGSKNALAGLLNDTIGFPSNDRGVELSRTAKIDNRILPRESHKTSKPEAARASPHLTSLHFIT